MPTMVFMVGIILFLTLFIVHFFACPKKRTKERAAVHLSASGGFPALLTKSRLLENVASLVQVAVLLCVALLGCVKWR
jgi:hypothetical protein